MRVKVIRYFHAGLGEPGFGGAAVPPTPAVPKDKGCLQRLKPRSGLEGPGSPRGAQSERQHFAAGATSLKAVKKIC